MTLQEILNMISLKFPHNYGDPDIITMINDVQRRIFRTMYKLQTAKVYDLLENEPFYPISFAPESIIDVVVNGKEYDYQNIKYQAQNCYYYLTEDNCIGLYPTPKECVTRGLTVFYYKEPNELNTNTLDASPDLNPAWHMMLVYHVCKELAEINPDKRNMVNTYIEEINELERQFYRSRPARTHRIQDVYGVGRGAL